MNKLKFLPAFCLLSVFYLFSTAQVKETAVKKELTELQNLKSDLLKMKTQLVQCNVNNLDLQSKLASYELSAEQSKLEEEFRVFLKPEKDSKFNWETMKFEPPTKTDGKIIK